MNGTLKLGRVAGILVRAHWSVLVVALLIADLLAEGILPSTVKGQSPGAYWGVGVTVCALFLGSLLAHEISHALVARRHGIVVKDITLWMLGGFTALEGEAHEAATALRVAVVGPLVSLACGALSIGLAAATAWLNGPRVVVAGFVWLGFTNGLLAVFNLLPGAPLDGGRVLQAVLWRRSGNRYAATVTASRAGHALGMVLICLGVVQALVAQNLFSGIWLALIGWFLMQASTVEGHVATLEHDLAGVRVDAAMETELAGAATWQPVAAAARATVEAGSEYCAVYDLGGDVTALLPVDALVDAARKRPELHVKDILTHLPPLTRADAADDLAATIERVGGALPIAVFRDNHLAGVVTRTSLERELRHRRVATPAS